MLLTSIPSPSQGVWEIGPIPIRAYALCILAGVVLAIVVGERRWVARGGVRGTVADVAVIAVPLGIVGGRLYHVVTSPQAYFGSDGNPLDALKVWEGGLGIPGALVFGALGSWWACRRRGVSIAAFGDAVAPGVALAQAVGRLGNWFNQELFGRATDLPWGLEIDPGRAGTVPGAATYHPTFLYESLWNIGVAALVIWADRRFRLGGGRAFALYVAAYATGRLWIEALRSDPANELLGLRVNVWISLLALAGAVLFLLVTRGRRREVPDGVGQPAQAPDRA